MIINLNPHGEERRESDAPRTRPHTRWPPPFETRPAALLRMRTDRSVDRHRREVDEPALRLHEILDLRRHRARPDVVRYPQECRLVDRALVQCGERLVARGRIERDAHGRGQLVEL